MDDDDNQRKSKRLATIERLMEKAPLLAIVAVLAALVITLLEYLYHS